MPDNRRLARPRAGAEEGGVFLDSKTRTFRKSSRGYSYCASWQPARGRPSGDRHRQVRGRLELSRAALRLFRALRSRARRDHVARCVQGPRAQGRKARLHGRRRGARRLRQVLRGRELAGPRRGAHEEARAALAGRRQGPARRRCGGHGRRRFSCGRAGRCGTGRGRVPRSARGGYGGRSDGGGCSGVACRCAREPRLRFRRRQ